MSQTYHTILTNGYTTQNGNNPAAAGGVTFVEIQRRASGLYRRRTDSNGRHTSSGPAERISAEEANALIDRAVSRGANNGGLSVAQAETLRVKLRLVSPAHA